MIDPNMEFQHNYLLYQTRMEYKQHRAYDINKHMNCGLCYVKLYDMYYKKTVFESYVRYFYFLSYVTK